jgi:beta-lactam-binding protein with PASTA domain
VALQGRKERKVFMKKTLLIVAMLLLVTPVMATTTIKVLVNPAERYSTGPDSNKVQPVTIAYVSDVNIRAFALDINIDSNNGSPNFQNIRNFKVGESNGTSPGYGIFPSRFRDFIQVLNATTVDDWNDSNYNPTTAWNEPETTDHNSGMGYPKMIVEMGTLFVGDANKPPLSGTLFKFDVNSYGQYGLFHITVKANALRGGVVNKDGNTITATYEANDANFPAPAPICTVPNVVNQPEATATANIVQAGFTLGTRTTTCDPSIVAGNVISTNPVSGQQPGCGTAVAYVVSTGPCCVIVPNVVDQPEATATANIVNAGLTLGARTTACSVTIVAGHVISTNPANPTCVALGTAVAYVVSIGTTPAVPASITVPATSANGTYAVTWAASTGATSYQLESSAPASGTTVFPLWVQIYNGTALTFTDKVGGGTWSYRVMATNACGSSGYRTGGNNCVVTNCLIGGNAGTSENSDWVKWRYPACWCYNRQCRGDVNGKKTGTTVSLADNTLLQAAYGKTDAQLAAITGGICSDGNHKKTGTRVSLADFTNLASYYGKVDTSVPLCNAAPIITGPYNYFTTP